MKTLPLEARLTEAETAAMCGVLVTRLGGSYSRLLGIRLASRDSDEIFKWLIASILLGAPVRADRAIAAYAALSAHSLLDPAALGAVREPVLVALLRKAGVDNYARRLTSTLRLAAGSVAGSYDSDINRLHFFADDASDVVYRLRSLGAGLSRHVVGLFLREMGGVWEKSTQGLPAVAVDAARHLGFIESRRHSESANELRELWESAAHGERTFADFEAALVRLGENFCSMRRCALCPIVKLCTGRLSA
jgi:endonuclease III